MKKLMLFVQLLLFTITIGYAQILHEGELDGNLKLLQFCDGSVKFYKVDSHEKSLLIFNMNNSLWRSIDLPIVKNHLIDEIKFIIGTSQEDETYFNILFTSYSPNSYSTEEVSDLFSTQGFLLNVIDDNGNVILKIPEAIDYEILAVNGKNKLLVYNIVRKGHETKSQLDVYGFSKNK